MHAFRSDITYIRNVETQKNVADRVDKWSAMML